MELGCGPIWRKPGTLSSLVDQIRLALSGLKSASPEALETSQRENAGHFIRRGALKADLLARRTWYRDQELPRLPARRFELLCALIRHEGPVKQEALSDELWGAGHDLKSVQMTIARLREDLKDFAGIEIRTDAHTYELIIEAELAASSADSGISRQR